MNTPAHLILGAAAFGGRRDDRRVIWAAFLGALLPDLSLYLLAGVSLLVLQIPPERVFNELYFSDAWQTVFAIDNSFLVWGALLALSLWYKSGWAIAVCGAAILHIALDFPLHHDDGRPHFWPVTWWVFESPVSYWDRRHGAMWVAPVEAALVVASAFLIWRRRPGIVISALVAVLLAMEILVVRQWLFFFFDS